MIPTCWLMVLKPCHSLTESLLISYESKYPSDTKDGCEWLRWGTRGLLKSLSTGEPASAKLHLLLPSSGPYHLAEWLCWGWMGSGSVLRRHKLRGCPAWGGFFFFFFFARELSTLFHLISWWGTDKPMFDFRLEKIRELLTDRDKMFWSNLWSGDKNWTAFKT